MSQRSLTSRSTAFRAFMMCACTDDRRRGALCPRGVGTTRRASSESRLLSVFTACGGGRESAANFGHRKRAVASRRDSTCVRRFPPCSLTPDATGLPLRPGFDIATCMTNTWGTMDNKPAALAECAVARGGGCCPSSRSARFRHGASGIAGSCMPSSRNRRNGC